MRGFYYGWRIVAVAMVVYMLVIGGTYSAYGLFVLPVSAEFGLSRADMNTGLIIFNLGTATLAPFIGRALDKTPARRIMIASALLMGLSFLALGLSHSLWFSAAVLAVTLPAAALGAGTLTTPMLIARWFAAQRGRAMALATIGMFTGGIAVTPLMGLAIEAYGWRTTLFLVGAVMTVILLGVSLVVRDRPGDDDIEAGGVQSAGQPGAVARAPLQPPTKVGVLLRMPRLWLIGLSGAVAVAVGQTLLITLVPLARAAGLSAAQATSLFPVMGVAAIIGVGVMSLVADKVDRVLLMVLICLMGAGMNVALLVLVPTYGLLIVCAALMGLANAGLTPVFNALLADHFGANSFGTARGLAGPMGAVASMVAIRFGGEVYDRFGGYAVAFIAFFVVQLIAAGLIFAVRFSAPARLSAAEATTG